MSDVGWTPAEQAMLDQQAALLRDHVQSIRDHWAGGCDHGGADTGACIGQRLEDSIHDLSDHNARVMYMEALIALAKGEGHGGETQGG